MIGSPLSAAILAASGYDPVARTMENSFRLCLYIGGFPAFTYLVAALIYLFGYKLTDAQAKEYAEFNAAKRAGDTAAMAQHEAIIKAWEEDADDD
jgi:Na+/melibiose symporter-like transporter